MAISKMALHSPILVFDSGVGGLSVLAEIRKSLPSAHIIYAADNAAYPYGTKSEAEIAARVPALLGRLAERYRPCVIVIACNTASTIALGHVRAALDVPVVGTVPAIKPAAALSKTKVIGLLGTDATIRQSYVDRLHADHAQDCTLIRFAAPDLVHAAEAKLLGKPVSRSVYAAAIAGLNEQGGGGDIDVVILGCTHFPLIRNELLEVAVTAHGWSPTVKFIDGATGIARRVLVLAQSQDWPGPMQGRSVFTKADDELRLLLPALGRYGLDGIEIL